MKKYAVWQDKLHVTSNSASTSLFNISLEFQGKKTEMKIVEMLVELILQATERVVVNKIIPSMLKWWQLGGKTD